LSHGQQLWVDGLHSLQVGVGHDLAFFNLLTQPFFQTIFELKLNAFSAGGPSPAERLGKQNL